ncbi:TrbI/VirB10 family protein [Vibrio breoganii]
MKNLDTKKKISVLLVALIVLGAAAYLFLGGGNAIVPANTGKVEVNLSPNQNNISRATQTDEVVIESEAISAIYEADRVQRLEEAKTNRSSFIQELNLNNNQKLSEDLENQKNKVKSQQDINSVLSINNDLEAKRKLAELEQRQRELATLEAERRELEGLRNLHNPDPLASRKNGKINSSTSSGVNGGVNQYGGANGGVNQYGGANALIDTGNQPPLPHTIYDQYGNIFDPQLFMANEVLDAQKALKDMDSKNPITIRKDDGQSHVAVSGYQYVVDEATGTLVPTAADAAGNIPTESFAQASARHMENTINKNNQRRIEHGVIDGNPNITNTQSASNYDNAMVNPAGTAMEPNYETIPPGEILYAILNIGINTDEISPVTATIIQEGVLRGARLIGTPELRGEKAYIVFNQAVIGKNTYPIEAIAIDLETLRGGLADNVNTHTFARYSRLMAAAFISGYADTLSDTSTRKYSDGSTETIVERLPDTKDQVAYAVGQAGKKLVPLFEKDFDREPTVTVDGGSKEIGIMILSPFEINL